MHKFYNAKYTYIFNYDYFYINECDGGRVMLDVLSSCLVFLCGRLVYELQDEPGTDDL